MKLDTYLLNFYTFNKNNSNNFSFYSFWLLYLIYVNSTSIPVTLKKS